MPSPASTPADAAKSNDVATATATVDTSTGSTYIVAPGRTIDGKLPGDEVTLSDADAVRLRDFGFILADDGSRVVPTGGPAVNVEDGVQVKQA